MDSDPVAGSRESPNTWKHFAVISVRLWVLLRQETVTRLGDLKENCFLLFPIKHSTHTFCFPIKHNTHLGRLDLGSDGFWKQDYGWGVTVRRPFGARGRSSVRYGTRLGDRDLKESANGTSYLFFCKKKELNLYTPLMSISHIQICYQLLQTHPTTHSSAHPQPFCLPG